MMGWLTVELGIEICLPFAYVISEGNSFKWSELLMDMLIMRLSQSKFCSSNKNNNNNSCRR